MKKKFKKSFDDRKDVKPWIMLTTKELRICLTFNVAAMELRLKSSAFRNRELMRASALVCMAGEEFCKCIARFGMVSSLSTCGYLFELNTKLSRMDKEACSVRGSWALVWLLIRLAIFLMNCYWISCVCILNKSSHENRVFSCLYRNCAHLIIIINLWFWIARK